MSLEPLQLASESSESPSISSRQLILTRPLLLPPPSQPNLLSRQPASQPASRALHCALCMRTHAHAQQSRVVCVPWAHSIATPARRCYGGRVVL